MLKSMGQTLTTTCNRDCPDTCTIKVSVEDGRAVRLRGDTDDPITRGFLCARTQRFLKRQYAPDRLTAPLIRRNGQLQEARWEDALDLAATKLLDARGSHGPASILHYRSGGSLGILKSLADVLFARFGPVTIKRGDICSGAGEAAQEVDFGMVDSNAVEDLDNARLIIVWGKNPHTSGVHLLPRLKAAKAAGTKVIAIDPMHTRMAGLADEFIQVRPGADYAIAMACIRRLFELDAVDGDAKVYCDNIDAVRALAFAQTHDAWAADADVPPAVLNDLAATYAATKPATILVGWGLGRRRNGATTVRAIDALAALSGNVGLRGGGASYYFARRSAFDVDFGFELPSPPRTLAEARLGEEILEAAEPAIKVAWVTAGNPVAMLPNSAAVQRAFADTFTIVVDTHPTDTTDVADIVLPTCTLLEDDDVLGAYGNHYLRVSKPTLAPPSGVRHELEIWQDLAARLGLSGLLDGSPRDWKRRAMGRLEAAGVTVERLEQGPTRNPFAPSVLFADRRFTTPSAKINLLDHAAEPAAPTTEAFPMTLLAVSTPDAQSSQWSTSREGPAEVAVHPDSANGVGDGDDAELVSAIGTLVVRVRHDRRVRRDVVQMAKGGQLRDGRCANVLVRAVETDLGGGAAYYDEGVRLRAISRTPGSP